MQGYPAAGIPYPNTYMQPSATVQQEQLREFWSSQMNEIHHVSTDPAEFKNHQLPLARIKKVSSEKHIDLISDSLPWKSSLKMALSWELVGLGVKGFCCIVFAQTVLSSRSNSGIEYPPCIRIHYWTKGGSQYILMVPKSGQDNGLWPFAGEHHAVPQLLAFPLLWIHSAVGAFLSMLHADHEVGWRRENDQCWGSGSLCKGKSPSPPSCKALDLSP